MQNDRIKGAAGACAFKGTERRRKPLGPHGGRRTKDEGYLLRKRAHRASPARSTPPNINEGRRTKVYQFGMPTKTTKTTKSLVVVLRFCSKLRNRIARDGRNECVENANKQERPRSIAAAKKVSAKRKLALRASTHPKAAQ